MTAARNLLLAATAVLALAACTKKGAPLLAETDPKAPVTAVPEKELSGAQAAAIEIPAGAYTLDKAHSTLTFKVSHMGFSDYVVRFSRFDAKLQLDPANPMGSVLSVSVDPKSLDVPSPTPDFLAVLTGEHMLDVAKFPTLTYQSARVEQTADNRARVTGDLTLHGVTKQVPLDVKFNGGYDGHPQEPGARVGFSGVARFKRSDFGVSYALPPAGSNMGVGDDVEVTIEAEFNGPPSPAKAGASPPAAPKAEPAPAKPVDTTGATGQN